MEFILNGEKKSYTGDPNRTLLNYLREDENITSPKDGCSCQATCGACTIMMDDKAILSCRTPMSMVEGKAVVTTDGLEQKIQDAFAKAFVEKGGIQCGFCIPGIVMRAKALLMKTMNPTRDDVKKAIHANICRCTGYVKIIDSIMYTAEILRGEAKEPAKVDGKVGTRLHKYDAYDTVLGKRPFVADLKFPGMLQGVVKMSDHPRALIKHIDLTEANAVEGVEKIFTAKDIPGQRVVGLIAQDWPMMIAEGEITNFIGDVLALVVAKDEETARKAVSLIKVEYDELEPITTCEQAMKEDAPRIHENGNILSLSILKKGDADKVLSESAHVAKGTFTTQRIEHAFMEPEACVSLPMKDGVEVYSQGQGPYVDRKIIAKVLKLEESQVNVHQVQNGGGFGGKEDTTVQHHSALAAYKLGKPVMVKLSREESIIMHPKRHPMKLKFELGCDSDGKLTALKADIVGDTGAYASVGMKVLERAAGHAAGGYEMPVVDLKATAVYTNNVPCGAMRGFGVNQASFAIEALIDELCKKGNFDRWEFRHKNVLDEGSELVTGQILEGGIGLKRTLEAVKEQFYANKYVGICCGIKNTGIGNGMPDTAKARIDIVSDTKIVIHHGWCEMGQGVHTMAIHTVCEETGLPPEIMDVVVETREEEECGMTTSSRGTSMIGNSLIDACKDLKEDLKTKSLKELEGKSYKGEWICDWTTPIGVVKPGQKVVTHYAYGYATQIVILDDDGNVKKIVAAHDAGKIMNPTLFEGQIEGGVVMGYGQAMTEDLPMEHGYLKSTRLADCKVPRAKDIPEIEVIGIEAGDMYGPYGAKGVGEIGLVPTMAATACAFTQYDGQIRYSLPLKRNK